jgi:uncharacterized protein (DUF952 family)
MTTILHITSLAAWEEARAIGLYEVESLQAQGFIHFSTAEQCVRVADSYYRGQRGLVLLVVDTERLTSPLKWEAPIAPANSAEMNPNEGEQFPHLYGPLNVDAVIKVLDFPPRDEDGTFALPRID